MTSRWGRSTRPGRLASDRDVTRITAERGDVVLDPLQCRHLIGGAVASRVVEAVEEPAEVQEALDTEAVVDGDGDHAVSRKSGPVVDRVRT